MSGPTPNKLLMAIAAVGAVILIGCDSPSNGGDEVPDDGGGRPPIGHEKAIAIG